MVTARSFVQRRRRLATAQKRFEHRQQARHAGAKRAKGAIF